MENKKFLPVKIIHLILMVAAIVLCCMALPKISADTEIASDLGLKTVSYVTEIVALVSGILYISFGYRKNAAFFYKMFLVVLTISQAVFAAREMTMTLSVPLVDAILMIVSLIMIVILATGKDLGKVNSAVVVGALIVCRVIALILDIVAQEGFPVLSYTVSDLLLAITAAFMIFGKYIDKAQRGSK